MTRIVFYSEDGLYRGFSVSGHSGYNDHGADIVCAAVTSAVRFCEAAVCDAAGIPADVTVSEQDAAISFFVKERSDEAGNIIRGMKIYFLQLQDEYPDNIKVMEEKLNA